MVVRVHREQKQEQSPRCRNTYRLIEGYCESDGAEGGAVYGIEVISWETGRPVSTVEMDVSDDREFVLRLMHLLERNGAGGGILHETVEDFLEENSGGRIDVIG